MLKIRLQRIGRRNQPHFRAVVTDIKAGPKSGNFIEIVGSYNPKLGLVEFNKDRVQYWLSQGAKTSDTVHNFLVDKKIIDGPKINALPKKTPIVKEVEEEEAPAEPKVEEKPAEETPEAEDTEDATEDTKEEETPAEESKEEEKPVEEAAPEPEEVKDEAPAEEEKPAEEVEEKTEE